MSLTVLEMALENKYLGKLDLILLTLLRELSLVYSPR